MLLILSVGWWLVRSASGRCWGIPNRRNGLTTTHELLLALETALGSGKRSALRSDQGVLDRPNLFDREDRFLRYGTWNRFLPCLEHFVHLCAS